MSFPVDHLPLRKASASGQRFGADFVVLDGAGTMLRGLNETAARVWELSDGTRTADSIAELLAREFAAAKDVIVQDCEFLARLVERGLVEDQGAVR